MMVILRIPRNAWSSCLEVDGVEKDVCNCFHIDMFNCCYKPIGNKMLCVKPRNGVTGSYVKFLVAIDNIVGLQKSAKRQLRQSMIARKDYC